MKILKSFQKWHLFWVWGRERERRAIVQKKRDSVVSSIYSRLNTHGPKMQFALLFNAIKCSQWTAAKRRALLALCCITCVVETFRTHDWKLMHGLSSQLGKLHCIDFVSVTLLWKGCRVLTLAVAQANHRHQSTQIFYHHSESWEMMLMSYKKLKAIIIKRLELEEKKNLGAFSGGWWWCRNRCCHKIASTTKSHIYESNFENSISPIHF